MTFAEIWPEVCDALGACALRERPGHFQAHGLQLYVGPNHIGLVVLAVEKTKLRYTPRMLELIKQYAQHRFPKLTVFGRKSPLPGDPPQGGREFDFFIQLDLRADRLSSREFTRLYHRLWSLLAAFGDFPGQSVARLARRVIPQLTPKFGGDHKRVRGKVHLEFAPHLDGELLVVTHGAREHSLHANFRLPIGARSVAFRSHTLPAPAWQRISLDDTLSDDFFSFDARSDLDILHAWIPLIQVLAMHDFHFNVESDEGTLMIKAEKVHSWTLGPLLQIIDQMWRTITAKAMNISQPLRAPAPFSSLKYRGPE